MSLWCKVLGHDPRDVTLYERLNLSALLSDALNGPLQVCDRCESVVS